MNRGGLRYWITAIRECFEECGVLLAYRDGALFDPVDTAERMRFDGYRNALAAGRLGLPEMARREALQLATDRVLYFSHWITPPSAPARFDTRFFIAAMPPGQRGSGTSRRDGGRGLGDRSRSACPLRRRTLADDSPDADHPEDRGSLRHRGQAAGRSRRQTSPSARSAMPCRNRACRPTAAQRRDRRPRRGCTRPALGRRCRRQALRRRRQLALGASRCDVFSAGRSHHGTVGAERLGQVDVAETDRRHPRPGCRHDPLSPSGRRGAGGLRSAGAASGALSAPSNRFIFQFFNLVPTLTVAENVLLPLELNGLLARRERALARLDSLGVGNLRDRFPATLSGGRTAARRHRPGAGPRAASGAGRRADRQPGQRQRSPGWWNCCGGKWRTPAARWWWLPTTNASPSARMP